MTDAVLDHSRRVLALVRSGVPDLTNRQMAMALIVTDRARVTGPRDPRRTVRGLAETLGVAKPVVTRAANTLAALGIVQRVRDAADGRNVFIHPGPQADTFRAALGKALSS